jgi:UDP-N-acetylmuramate dehydrogenase
MIEIRENIRLAPYTTLRVGGNARYFAEAANPEDVIEAVQWARSRALPVFVLGGGSNLLVSDAGFHGLVLRMGIGGISSRSLDGQQIFSVGAGVDWDSFVARAVKDDCAGVECLSGIPGTVGGTPIQNVGAYGQDVSETIVQVSAIDTTTLERVTFDKAACGFSYRQSRFNGSEPRHHIVTRVDYALQPCGTPKLVYSDLKRHFSDRSADHAIPALSEVRDAVLAIRRAKGMVLDEDDVDSRSAGSFFKNPVVSLAVYEQVAASSSVPVPHFDASPGHVKLAAAWLIEQAGIGKGFVLGPVAISSKHTLALINRGGATAADLLQMKEYVQQQVRLRFAVELLPEPVMLGFDIHD